MSNRKLGPWLFVGAVGVGLFLLFKKPARKAAPPEAVLTPRLPPCGDMGDVDGDGMVTENDAKLIGKHLAGKYDLTNQLTPDQARRADVKGDGRVSVVDALLIAKYLAGTIDTFPVCSLEVQ